MVNLISAVFGGINFAGATTLVFRSGVAIAIIALASQAQAEAVLKAKTASDFAKYVAATEARRARDITDHGPFLDIQRQTPEQLALAMGKAVG